MSNPSVVSKQILISENSESTRVTITEVHLEAGASQPRHTHESSEQIWYAIKGDGQLLLATKFLCFNYTDTLETVYGIPRNKICYIHGKAKESANLYFGHNNDKDYDYFLSQQDISSLSVADGYDLINAALRKPVANILNNNKDFFESLDTIDEVYSHGFSYNPIDEAYIKAIIAKTPKLSAWHINSFPPIYKKNSFKRNLKEWGYNDIITEFD